MNWSQNLHSFSCYILVLIVTPGLPCVCVAYSLPVCVMYSLHLPLPPSCPVFSFIWGLKQPPGSVFNHTLWVSCSQLCASIHLFNPAMFCGIVKRFSAINYIHSVCVHPRAYLTITAWAYYMYFTTFVCYVHTPSAPPPTPPTLPSRCTIRYHPSSFASSPLGTSCGWQHMFPPRVSRRVTTGYRPSP